MNENVEDIQGTKPVEIGISSVEKKSGRGGLSGHRGKWVDADKFLKDLSKAEDEALSRVSPTIVDEVGGKGSPSAVGSLDNKDGQKQNLVNDAQAHIRNENH